MALDFTTVARVASRLAPGSTSLSGNDTLVGQMIASTSAAMERWLGREALATAYVETFDVCEGQEHWPLKAWPVSAVTYVREDSERVWGSDTDVDADDYVSPVVTGDMWLTIPGGLAAGRATLRVSYTGGMAATTTAFIAAYPDLALACEVQVSWDYLRRKDLGTVSKSGDKGAVALDPAAPFIPQVLSLLGQYRVIRGPAC